MVTFRFHVVAEEQACTMLPSPTPCIVLLSFHFSRAFSPCIGYGFLQYGGTSRSNLMLDDVRVC